MHPTDDPDFAAELRSRIAAGEGRRLELKRGLPGDPKVARTLAAFANGVGGLLLVGVDDDHTLVGAPRPEETADHLVEVAAAAVEPPLEPFVTEVAVDGVRLVVCFVPASDRAPHRARDADGRWDWVLRRAASTRRVDRAESERDLARRPQLDDDERRLLARVPSAKDGDLGDGTDEAALATELGLAPSRVRRALVKLERSGRILGWSKPGAARRYAAP
ncbi:MAG: ATP-binding protein [Planctomycetota bacterium]